MKATTRYLVGDVFDVLPTLEDASVDLVMTSPPFLALRSYLPADHPDKAKEIGSEATPAAFIDTLLDVVEAIRPKLTRTATLVFELGDTYADSGGPGGDYSRGGLRDGQPTWVAQRKRHEGNIAVGAKAEDGSGRPRPAGPDYPLPKSLCLIPQLFAASLAYGYNLLRPERTTEPWRIRNVVAWCRPNPPVGALGDKFRPATSYLTVATMARDRWFDMDAVRVPVPSESAGAPLLDYWEIPTQPYKGAHYATFPEELPRRVILSMCPERVCLTCGEPSRRITSEPTYIDGNGAEVEGKVWPSAMGDRSAHAAKTDGNVTRTTRTTWTLGWTDCGHGDAWRPGLVLDPFAGSGTTLRMALGNGRSSIGIDLDERNAQLALDRVGPLYMDVVDELPVQIA